MTGVNVDIAPEMLNWIIKKAQYEHINSTTFDMLLKWQSGEKVPTFNQIEKISKKTNIPFGYFFLKTPPQEKCSIVDYRTVDSLSLQEPSRNLIDTLDAMAEIQEWMREYLKDNGFRPLDFIGKYNKEPKVMLIVDSIRHTLNLDIEWFRDNKTPTDSFSYIRKRCEDVGILVMVNGVVGQNTHRKLDLSEFRAFTLVDNYAPLIFINTNDSITGKLFSLLHELAHIWIGIDSLFNVQENGMLPVKPIEQICNAVAADILAPNELFIEKWTELDGTNLDKVTELSKSFRCSKSVITRKALQNNFITKRDYDSIIADIITQYQIWKDEQNGKRSAGGDYYKTMSSRLDHRFLKALENSVKEGKIQYTEAYRMTNTNRTTFSNLINEIGGARW